MPIWLGTGGSPAFVYRASALGVPILLGLLGTTPDHQVRLGNATMKHGLKRDTKKRMMK